MQRTLPRTPPLRLPEAVAIAVLAGWVMVAVIITVGLPAAIVGRFTPAVVMPLVGLFGFGVWRVGARQLREVVSAVTSPAAGYAFMAAALVVGVTLGTNLLKASEHHATNRDPGVYLETGLWLAEHGTLELDGREGPFLDNPDLDGGGLGFTEFGEKRQLHAQFGHATATVIGVGAWLGGSALATRVPALLTAAGLLMWWFVLRRVSSPWWATAGVSALAVNLVFIHFSRDTFSEPLAFLLLAGAVALTTTRPSALLWGLAGWTIGLAVAARVDMIVVVLGAMLLALLKSPTKGRTATALVISAAAGTGLSFTDLGLRSPEYLSDRWPSASAVVALTAVVALLSLLGVLVGDRLLRIVPHPVGDTLPRIAVLVVGSLLIVGAIYGLTIRPLTAEPRTGFTGHIAGLQSRDGLNVDGTRTYGENSALWLTWYAGVGAVVLAVLGAVLTVGRMLHERKTSLVAPIVLLAPMTLLYLQRPRITGDQIWAMRRFFPTAIPLLILLACVASAWISDSLQPRLKAPTHRTLTLILAGVLVLPPLATTWPARADQTVLWATATIEGLCDALGPDAAVLILDQGLLGSHLVNATRRQCAIPTARGTVEALDLTALSAAWKAEGHHLVVLEYAEFPVDGLIESGRYPMPQRHLDFALDGVPDQIQSGTREISLWRVPGSEA